MKKIFLILQERLNKKIEFSKKLYFSDSSYFSKMKVGRKYAWGVRVCSNMGEVLRW